MIEITSRLPSDYQEVEYLESTGTQYIDTGYTVNASDTISWEFTATIPSQSEAHMGANGYMQFHVTPNGVGISTLNASGLGAKKTFRIDFSNSVTKLYIDNTLVETRDWTGSYSGTNVKLGIFKLGDASNGWHTTVNPVSCTLYEYAINISGNEVSHCVPCYRKSDNVAGLYDLVRGQFFVNAGTGTFTVGANVADEIIITAGGVIPKKYALRRRMMMCSEPFSFEYTGTFTDVINGSNRIITLTSSGTLTVKGSITAEVYMLAGGGGGMYRKWNGYTSQASGGGGGYQTIAITLKSGTYEITIGTGGAGAYSTEHILLTGGTGGNTTAFDETVTGGTGGRLTANGGANAAGVGGTPNGSDGSTWYGVYSKTVAGGAPNGGASSGTNNAGGDGYITLTIPI